MLSYLKRSSMKTQIITLLIIVLFVNSLQAQTTRNKLNTINKQLSSTEQKNIKNANETITSADLFTGAINNEIGDLRQAEYLKENGDTRSERRAAAAKAKMLSDKLCGDYIHALNVYKKGYDVIYTSYRNRLKAYDDLDGQEYIETMTDLLGKAQQSIENANNLQKKISKEKDNLGALNMSRDFITIINLRQEAIDYLVECFCLHIECELHETVRENIVVEETTAFPDANEENLVIFKVQIIAVSKPLPDNKLSGMYPGSVEVTKKFENGLYKYAVGHFFTYDEAKDFQQGVGGDSFVIGMFNGDKLPIKEAIERSRKTDMSDQ